MLEWIENFFSCMFAVGDLHSTCTRSARGDWHHFVERWVLDSLNRLSIQIILEFRRKNHIDVVHTWSVSTNHRIVASLKSLSEYGSGLSSGFALSKCSLTCVWWRFCWRSFFRAFVSSGSIEINDFFLHQLWYCSYFAEEWLENFSYIDRLLTWCFHCIWRRRVEWSYPKIDSCLRHPSPLLVKL